MNTTNNASTNTDPKSFYTEVTGAQFENVLNEDGTTYHFHPAWRCTGFADANHPRIPKRDANYVFEKGLLQDLLIFLMYPQGTALWVTGPTGCGKTSAIMQVASRLNWPVVDLTLNNRFEFTDLRGQWGLTQEEGQTSPTMKYIHNALPLAMRNGWILILNEADLASPGELSALNDVIEGRSLLIAEHRGEAIKPHPMFRLIVTANSAGSGDQTGLYQGVQEQNVAAMDRYRMLKVRYPSQGVEEGILQNVAPNIDATLRAKMCQFAQEMRLSFIGDKAMGGTISVPFSTRTLVNWASTAQFYTSEKNALRKSLQLFFLNKLSVEEAEAADSIALTIFGECWKD
ncbi:AAA family ATPase [Sutterella sp.]|uniref:AAA family ATPase n=1 Tax=Sutterella sp. TaxID=1981025 RepID=UPI003FD7C743